MPMFLKTYLSRLFLLCLIPPLMIGCSQRRTAPPKVPVTPEVHSQIQESLNLSYDELFESSPSRKFSTADLEAMREHQRESQDYCTSNVKARGQMYDKQLDELASRIKLLGNHPEETQRHNLHCQIQELRSAKAQTDVLSQNLVPVAYENSRAKIDLLEKWPSDLQQIEQEIKSGTYLNRRWSNVNDIGFRNIEKDQKDDIKRGQDAIREMQQQRAMPAELDNKQIQDYVNTLAQRLAANSDLLVPLKVVVLDSKEVNAFALPGGFLFVQRGLLEAADDESELAGVLAHEMSHVAARHGYKLMKKAMISSILFQAAQLAAIIGTGGAAGAGTYYALQYGFYGLGFALDLNLLGVSRDFETEADQLGIQYAWKTGYDPNGFIRFFDKMASKEGNVIGASWFRTHPLFYDRMVQAKREITFLPRKEQAIVQTTQFEAMKRTLKEQVVKSNAEEDKKRPTLLLSGEQGCTVPKKLYQDTDSIEKICSQFVPPATVPNR
ncbi:MAG TPA: M48 family metalloprotease [Alphaproteobacteria bacterium]|nr:M48 family metalloprotease [Alphaproteobacteria bacterium]